MPFSSPGDIPDPGLEPGSPALQADSLLTELQGKPPHQHPSLQISLWPAPAILLFRVTGLQFSSVQSLNCVQLFAITWTAARQASLSFTISQSLIKLMSIESVMPSNHFTLCHSLLLPSSIFPSIRVFSNESFLHIRLPNY